VAERLNVHVTTYGELVNIFMNFKVHIVTHVS